MSWLETGHSKLHGRILQACDLAAALKPEHAGENSLLDFKRTVCFHQALLEDHVKDLETEEENKVRKALEIVVELFIRIVYDLLVARGVIKEKDVDDDKEQ